MSPRVAGGYSCIAAGLAGLAVAGWLLVGPSLEEPPNSETMLALGEERFAGGDPRGALEWFSKAKKAAPNKAGPRLSIGRVLELLGRKGEALASFRDAVKLEPDEVEPVLMLARALDRAGHRNDAAENFEKVAKAHPEAPELLLELAAFRLESGNVAGAAKAYEELEGRHPTDPRGTLGLAGLFELRGNHKQAREAYEKAATIDAKSTVAWEGFGRTAAVSGEVAKAQEAYEKLVALRPDDAGARVVLATLIEKQGDFDAASVVFRQALDGLEDAGPRDLETRALAWTGLGTCLLATGDRDQAYQAFASALTDDPDQSEAMWSLAPIYLARKQWGAAADALRKVIPSRGNETILWIMLGRAEAGRGRWIPARTSFERAHELDPTDVQARLWLGISLRVLGAYRRASAMLEAVVRSRPDEPLGQLNLAIARGLLGEEASAREHFARARQLMPGQAAPLAHEAHLDLALGRAADAVQKARLAVELEPTDPAALEVLSRALVATNQTSEARQVANEALRHAANEAQREYLQSLLAPPGQDQ